MKKLLTLTALGTILMAADAMAAGFHLREQSAAAQGNAFAGATAGAENNSYAYFNVAGLTRHKGTQGNAGVTYIAPRAEASDVKTVPAKISLISTISCMRHGLPTVRFLISWTTNGRWGFPSTYRLV